MDAIGVNPAALHTLWAMSDLGVLDWVRRRSDDGRRERAAAPLRAAVRKTALTALPRNEAAAKVVLDGKMYR